MRVLKRPSKETIIVSLGGLFCLVGHSCPRAESKTGRMANEFQESSITWKRGVYVKTTISPEVFEKATRCNKGFICQSHDWVPCGSVTGMLGKAILALEQGQYGKKRCPYHVTYGTRDYCTCPARVEIYHRYRM
jgi:hypothetical protein